jgi:hypothetical protein
MDLSHPVTFGQRDAHNVFPPDHRLDFGQLATDLTLKEAMSAMEFLPENVRAGLEAARKRDAKRRARLRVRVGDETYPVLRIWDTGFALDAEEVPHLRGLVDLYDGSRHLMQCLIVASVEDRGELVCDFKWTRAAADRPPVDFAEDENAPAALLPRD